MIPTTPPAQLWISWRCSFRMFRIALWWLEHPALARDELPLYLCEVIPLQLTIVST